MNKTFVYMNIYKSLFLWKMEDMISMIDKTYYNGIELDRRNVANYRFMSLSKIEIR